MHMFWTSMLLSISISNTIVFNIVFKSRVDAQNLGIVGTSFATTGQTTQNVITTTSMQDHQIILEPICYDS